MSSIIVEISRMKRAHYNKTGCVSSYICLDDDAEERLVQYIIDKIKFYEDRPYIHDEFWTNETAGDIRRNGIRHLGIRIFGMELLFGYAEFCVGRAWDGAHFV